MTNAYPIAPLYPVFTGLDGKPLEAGYIYIGAAGQNPEASPAAVFWDEDLTIPASQPIRTIAGYPSRNGSPAAIFTAGDFSITVRDRNRVLIYTGRNGAFPSWIYDALSALRGWTGQAFDADGRTGLYPVDYMPNDKSSVLLLVDGVPQEYGRDYTFESMPSAVSGFGLRVIADPEITAPVRLRLLYTKAMGQAAASGALNIITPEMFGAIGDGVSDDTVPVIAAVADAATTGRQVFFSGEHLTTGTIPNLHNIYKFGPGAIKIGSRLFPVQPQRTEAEPRNVAPDESDVTNTLFVATNGNDDNDGLGTGRELLTLGGAFNVMANYGPTLSGLWKVSMASGTYAANASAGHKFMSHSPIFIEGQTTGGTAWAEPTTIIDGVNYTLNGIGFNYYQAAYLKDIKTTRCANGVIATRHCSVVFENVWSEDDLVGRSILTQSYHANKGGQIIAAQSIGVQELFNTVSSYNEDASNYLLIDGQGITETGWQRKECCSGHVDYVEIMDCTEVEFELQSQCTANVGNMKLGGGSSASPVGIMVANSEIHDFDDVVYNAVNPATTPIRIAGSGQVTDQYGWTGDASALTVGLPAPVLIKSVFSDVPVSSGAGSDLNLIGVTLRQGFFRMAGYCFRVEVNGTITDNGSGGVTAGTLQFRPQIGGSTMFSLTIPAGYLNKNFRFAMEVTTTAAGSQEYWATAMVDGASPIFVAGTATNTDTGTTPITMKVRRSVGTDVFTIKSQKVFG